MSGRGRGTRRTTWGCPVRGSDRDRTLLQLPLPQLSGAGPVELLVSEKLPLAVARRRRAAGRDRGDHGHTSLSKPELGQLPAEPSLLKLRS